MFVLRPRRLPDVKECRLVSFVAMSLSYGSPTRNIFLLGVVPVPVGGDVHCDACDDSSAP
jgi:hypothetical protein